MQTIDEILEAIIKLVKSHHTLITKVFNLSIFTGKCQSAKKIWQKLHLFFYMSYLQYGQAKLTTTIFLDHSIKH